MTLRRRFGAAGLRRGGRAPYFGARPVAEAGSGALSGSFSGAATVSAQLDLLVKLSGSFSGSATFTGALASDSALQGSFAGTSSWTGNAKQFSKLQGSFAGAATVTGHAKQLSKLSGAFAGTAALAGNAKSIAKLAGAFTGTGSVTGNAKVFASLAGAFSGAGTVTGNATVTVSLGGSFAGAATFTGDTVDVGGPTVWYAKPSATGTGAGTSWANADDLAGAYASASSGEEVWCIAGTYTDKITPKDGVTLRGGFDATTPESSAASRDLENNITTIDGQGTGRCFGHLDCTSAVTATIEAIRCYRGYADDYEVAIEWEGVFSLEIAGSSTVVMNFERCTFESCTGLIGSCIAIYDDGGGGSATINIVNCVEYNCVCIDDERAFYVEIGGTMNVLNCALVDTNAGAQIIARITGGTIDCHNSILWVVNNTVATPYSGTITFDYCDVADAAPSGTGNISSDPLWTDDANGDFTLGSTSPCIDAGDGDEAPTLDMWLQARYDDGGTGGGTPDYTDMGPLEYQGA